MASTCISHHPHRPHHPLHQKAACLFLVLMAASGGVRSAPPTPSAPTGIFGGSGPGVHSPNSPVAPLPQRSDVLPWSLLTDVKVRDGAKGPRPRFNAGQQALHDKTQRVQGFMMPLEPGEKQKHFLLSAVPLTCAFCIPGGPESMVEITTKTSVQYTIEPVVVEGKFAVLPDDPYGLYYRITDGVQVK